MAGMIKSLSIMYKFAVNLLINNMIIEKRKLNPAKLGSK